MNQLDRFAGTDDLALLEALESLQQLATLVSHVSSVLPTGVWPITSAMGRPIGRLPDDPGARTVNRDLTVSRPL
jgi:hypothetical protein